MIVCCKLPGEASISHGTPNECFVEGQLLQLPSLELLCADRVENTVSKSNSTVVEACLPRRCIATAVVSLFVSSSLRSKGSGRHSMYEILSN
jgi:hypothetical protein